MSHEKVFTLGSLFSGIGGLELGLEWTGRFKTVWQVENNEYCRRVLEKHWPDAQRFEDVRNVGKENLPPVDVICGGFPCQDVSVAGKKAGLREGTRSGLWFEYARVVRELRPSYVIVENVPGLLVGGGLGVVLGDLAIIGYDAEWQVLSAAGVGAPHLRRRVFLLAYANGRRSHTEQISRGERKDSSHADWNGAEGTVADAESNGRRQGHSHDRRSVAGTQSERKHRPACGGEVVADSDVRRCEQRNARERSVSVIDESRENVSDTFSVGQSRPRQPINASDPATYRKGQASNAVDVRLGNQWSIEPAVGRVAHGVPSRVDRLRALGNAVVPQCAKVVGEWLLQIDAELNASEVA